MPLELAKDENVLKSRRLGAGKGDVADAYRRPGNDIGAGLSPPNVARPVYTLGQINVDKLELVQLSDWEEGKPYDEDPAVYLHYSTEWKVLRQKLESWVKTKTQRSRRVRSEDTINAESTSGQAPAWEHVYRLMRCPGKPCDLGIWCWQDPTGKKHYSLKTHHLINVVKYVRDENGTLETHDDVPGRIREQLCAEEQQRSRSRVQKGPSVSTSTGNPININLTRLSRPSFNHQLGKS
ncbi:hypothetical protein BDW68DRAFT_192993 [Aspergillus falconensis]